MVKIDKFSKNSLFGPLFGGGFAVDADFGDGFSGSIEGPKIIKNR
jgi:hypothetical protein